MSYIHRIVIGDRCGDGHGKWDSFTFECNYDEVAVKKAYKKVVKKCKIALHEPQKGAKSICCEYGDRSILKEDIAILEKLGVAFSFSRSLLDTDGLCVCGEEIAYLFFEMVKTQLKNFEYRLIKEPEPINGYYGFGYGCYY